MAQGCPWFVCLALTITVAPRTMASRAAARSPLGLDPVRGRDVFELASAVELLLPPPVVAPPAAVVVVARVVVVACEASVVLVPGLAVVVVVVGACFTTAVMAEEVLPLKVGAPR